MTARTNWLSGLSLGILEQSNHLIRVHIDAFSVEKFSEYYVRVVLVHLNTISRQRPASEVAQNLPWCLQHSGVK